MYDESASASGSSYRRSECSGTWEREAITSFGPACAFDTVSTARPVTMVAVNHPSARWYDAARHGISVSRTAAYPASGVRCDHPRRRVRQAGRAVVPTGVPLLSPNSASTPSSPDIHLGHAVALRQAPEVPRLRAHRRPDHRRLHRAGRGPVRSIGYASGALSADEVAAKRRHVRRLRRDVSSTPTASRCGTTPNGSERWA